MTILLELRKFIIFLYNNLKQHVKRNEGVINFKTWVPTLYFFIGA